MNPTVEQQKILDEDGNIVVVAKPGSGKTFVLSEKIRQILPVLKYHEGVIAISFTNKASDDLKNRSLKSGLDRKESFFGTIHKFYLSEIILSFGKQLFGLPQNEIEIIDIYRANLDNEEKNYLENLEKNFDYSNAEHIEYLKYLFLEGKIYLSLVEKFAIFIYDNSLACQKYLKSKYKYIIIDEFQDCGQEQYEIFMRLKNLDLIAIAVGDLDQSIYGFTGKSSEFLSTLIEDQNFKTFSLTRNHRCHPSIINYSLSLMSTNVQLLETDNTIRMYHRHTTGNEGNIAKWIDDKIQQIMDKFGVETLSEIGILTKSNRTAKIIDENLNTPHKIVKQSLLENYAHPVAQLFDNILKFAYDSSSTVTEIIEKFVSLETLKKIEQKVLKQSFEKIKNELALGEINFENIKLFCGNIATILLPNQNYQSSIEILEKVLNEELEIYSNKLDNEIQIMTLHKSKGLEFDIVFHLDLYEWILPAKGINNGQPYHLSYSQDLNLHYVGVTRAKKTCILCTSPYRTNGQNQQKNGNLSEFLNLNNVSQLRK